MKNEDSAGMKMRMMTTATNPVEMGTAKAREAGRRQSGNRANCPGRRIKVRRKGILVAVEEIQTTEGRDRNPAAAMEMDLTKVPSRKETRFAC